VEEVIQKQVDKEFHTCAKCGYKSGFHVSFSREDGDLEIVLICPSCGQRYKLGWRFTSTETA